MWCGVVVSNSNGHAGNIGNVETMCTSSLQQTNRQPSTANHQPTPQSTAVDTNQQPPRTYNRNEPTTSATQNYQYQYVIIITPTVETMCTSSLQTNHQQTTVTPNINLPTQTVNNQSKPPHQQPTHRPAPTTTPP
jgi:hypothetical protein